MYYSISFYISLVVIITIISWFLFRIKLSNYFYLVFITLISFRFNSRYISIIIFSFNSYDFTFLDKVLSFLSSEFFVFFPFWIIWNLLLYFIYNRLFFWFYSKRFITIVLRLVLFFVIYSCLYYLLRLVNTLFDYFELEIDSVLSIFIWIFYILYSLLIYYFFQYLKDVFKIKDFDYKVIYVIIYIVFMRLIIYLILLVFNYDICHLYYSNDFHRSLHKMIYNLFSLQERCFRAD